MRKKGKKEERKRWKEKSLAFQILCKGVLDVFACVKLWQGGGKVSDTDIFLVFAGCGLPDCQISSAVRLVTCFKHFPFCFPCSIKSSCVAVCVSGWPWQTEQHPRQCSPAVSLCLWLQQLYFCSTLPREPRLPPPSPGELNNFLVLSVWLSIHRFLNKKTVILLNIWNCQAFLRTLYFSCSERDSCLFLSHRNGPSRRCTAPAFLQHCHSLP